MKRPSDPQKVKFWKAHLAAMKSYGGNKSTYCREQGIKYHDVIYWRNRLAVDISQEQLPAKLNPFLPVNVFDSEFSTNRKSLPEAKWLAEVIFEIHARFQ